MSNLKGFLLIIKKGKMRLIKIKKQINKFEITILKESVKNIVKHAQVKHVVIRFSQQNNDFHFEIRDDDIDAHQLGVGEHHAAVDNNNVIAIAQGHAVHPKLA